MARPGISCYKVHCTILFTLITALIINWTCNYGILANVLTSYDEDTISTFRELVQDLVTKDYMKSDGYMLRWLRYTDFDVEKAYKAFKDSINWRKENKIDTILQEGYSYIEESYTYSFNGFDKEGRPVLFIPSGSYDLRKILLSGTEYLNERSSIRGYELAETYLQDIRIRTGFNNITQVIIISDLAGFNLKQTGCVNCLKILPGLFAQIEPNYPLLLHKSFIINAPQISYSAIQLTKHFMSKETKESLQVFGYDKDKWSKALLEQISYENLPIKYGGIKPDFDKASFAIRNAAVMHLLGNRQDVPESAANKDQGNKHNSTTTVENISNHNPSHNSIKVVWNTSTAPSVIENNVECVSESVNVAPRVYKPPISWFDSSFDWTEPLNKMTQNSNSLSKAINNSLEEKEVHFQGVNNKLKDHHHHYRNITPNEHEQFISTAENFTIAHDFSVAASTNNLFTRNYVSLIHLMFANFIIIILL